MVDWRASMTPQEAKTMEKLAERMSDLDSQRHALARQVFRMKQRIKQRTRYREATGCAPRRRPEPG